MAYLDTVGKIHENGKIEKEFFQQGYIYKNFEAFCEKTNEVCYIPELDDAEFYTEGVGYTYQDFVNLAKEHFEELGVNGIPEILAEVLFEFCDWQHPETLLDEWDNMGEFENYPESHGIKK